jgi:hypothetical protein
MNTGYWQSRNIMVTLRSLLPMTLWLALVPSASAQQEARLSVSVNPANELVVAIQPAFHLRYGCLYPMTYQIQIPEGSSGLTVERRHSCIATWDMLPEKMSTDLFNGIEAVRFDYSGNRAHVSAAFAGDADSLFLRIRDSAGNPTSLLFRGIDTYYDDRRAVVTVSADDWDNSMTRWFCSAVDVFRSYGLYVTGGVITGTGRCSAPTWGDIQREADSGYLEVASHSRTHSGTPYADPPGEVEGSADDIVSHVRLPVLFSSNGRQYVYVWIAPYGDYDSTVDSLVGVRGYLIPRLYNYPGQWTLSGWDAEREHFDPIQPTLEIGAPSWGGGSTDSSFMNGSFDNVVAAGGVYHLMWHPQVVRDDLNKPYFISHLRHISGHSDIWYANLGHVYLYHLIEQANRSEVTAVAAGEGIGSFELRQNYPNPFNPTTTIGFDVAERAFVSVCIFNVRGQRIATLVEGPKGPGRYNVSWDAMKITSGMYFCRLEAAPVARRGRTFTSTKKMLLVR